MHSKFHYIYPILLLTVLYSYGNIVQAQRQNPTLVLSDTMQPIKILKTKIGTEIPVYSFEAFENNILKSNEPSVTYVINFWATWCGPCVAELPYFFELEEQYAVKNVKFIYVSLDFLKNLEKKLLPFVETGKIKNKVIVLDQKDVNSWMEKIDKNWSGAIPATLIYNTEKRIFLEQNFESTADLENAIIEFIP